ncbi:MAG: N-acetylmuramoyl-L-alanine amidase [Candidatus Omnitrophica bacterium]|nr:N-acetylmuramoyl-L-alanine amidase [Candidatus Omnitrophota bacterium]
MMRKPNYFCLWRDPARAGKFCLVILGLAFCLLHFIGCATVPQREAAPTYAINGTTYLSLIPLCEQRGITWDYDTFTRIVFLSKGAHKVSLRIGDRTVMVDGSPQYFRHPVDIYQGAVVVPSKFKEQVLDTLFSETYPGRPAALPIIKLKKIVIDAGHGGNDPGAIGRTGLREKDVNLDIAKRLARLLEAQGIKVVMTRTVDRFISLDRRVQIANNSHADLFVSIHSNANRVRSLSGFEVYYVSPSLNDSKRAYETAKDTELDLTNASFASNSLDLKATLWDMVYTNSRAEAVALSSALCRSLDRNLDTKILGIKAARFEVLRDAQIPAVLIETGFLSNSNEERMLKNSYYRQRLAQGILEGIEDYSRDVTLVEVASR